VHPEIHVSCLSVLTAAVASFFFSFLWHGPLFGKKWAGLMGFAFDPETCGKPNQKMMFRGMALSLVGAVLTAFVLVHSTNAWRPSVWGAGTDSPWYIYGFFSGFFTWLGFYVPAQLNTVAWEKRKWELFCLNSAFHFLNLQIMAMVVAGCYS